MGQGSVSLRKMHTGKKHLRHWSTSNKHLDMFLKQSIVIKVDDICWVNSNGIQKVLPPKTNQLAPERAVPKGKDRLWSYFAGGSNLT